MPSPNVRNIIRAQGESSLVIWNIRTLMVNTRIMFSKFDARLLFSKAPPDGGPHGMPLLLPRVRLISKGVAVSNTAIQALFGQSS